jgi:hypothetical protein
MSSTRIPRSTIPPRSTDASAQALDDTPEVQILDLDADLPSPGDPGTQLPVAAAVEIPLADTARRAITAALPGPKGIRSRSISLSHHQRECRICKHSQRADIEQDFLDWWSAWGIVKGYGLGHTSALYRHAHATGLFARRHAVRTFALERMVEQVSDVSVSAFSIVMAMRLLNQMLEKETPRARRRQAQLPSPEAPK